MREQEQKNGKKVIWIMLSMVTLFFLIGLFLWQFNKDMREAERMRNKDKMIDIAEKAALVAENRLTGTISILETMAENLDLEEAMNESAMMEYFSKMATKNGMAHIGIIDSKGRTITEDRILSNLEQIEFYKISMKGENYVSCVFEAKGLIEKSIAISVPLKAESGQVQGVLYGVILVKDFDIHEDPRIKNSDRNFIHIVDADGNYIAKGKHGNYICKGKENLYDIFKESGVEKEEARKLLASKKSTFKIVYRDGELRIMCFSPMSVENWCVVVALTGDAANVNIDFFQKIVITLIIKILLAVGAVIAIGYHLLNREKMFIKNLNHELSIKDQIFQIAATEAKSYVFIYYEKTKRIEFMNHNEDFLMIFQEQMVDFPKHVPDFISRESMTYREINRMFEEIEAGKSTIEGEISFDQNGTIFHYKVKITDAENYGQSEKIKIGSMVDVTQDRQNEIFLQSKVGKDPLTKVYNRQGAIEKINKILKMNFRNVCACLIIDLDNFKAVNDSLGHLVGDKALIDVANIIKKHVRSRDIVCRIGGDEFIVFLEEIPRDVIDRNVDALLRKLQLTYEMEGKKESFSASMGIAVAPEDGSEFEELYAKADKALYEVKKTGKNNYAFYKEK